MQSLVCVQYWGSDENGITLDLDHENDDDDEEIIENDRDDDIDTFFPL